MNRTMLLLAVSLGLTASFTPLPVQAKERPGSKLTAAEIAAGRAREQENTDREKAARQGDRSTPATPAKTPSSRQSKVEREPSPAATFKESAPGTLGAISRGLRCVADASGVQFIPRERAGERHRDGIAQ